MSTFNQHANELGDWCPWSGCSAAPDAARCPAGCPDSRRKDDAVTEHALLPVDQMADHLSAVEKLGKADGAAAASWVFSGNTDRQTYAQWAQWLANDDDELWEHYAPPLSGEWADELTPRDLVTNLGLALDVIHDSDENQICDAYETAHRDAWLAEITRAVRYQVEG